MVNVVYDTLSSHKESLEFQFQYTSRTDVNIYSKIEDSSDNLTVLKRPCW